jgi:hypothetical protein
MFGLFRKKPQDNSAAIIRELEHLYVLVAKLNVPVIADDVDAGYDMAIDEVLDIIDARVKYHLNPTTENV